MNHWLGKEKWELIIKLKLTKRTLFSQCRKLTSGCKNANSIKKSVMFQVSKPLNQAFLKTHMVCPINPEKWFDASSEMV